MSNQRLRVLIWCAVSKPHQATPDKISLIEQERSAREWVEKNGCEVVGILTVPGESRSETDVLTIFEEFAEKGIFAYHDLRRMWQEPRQFDILVCYHDSRLARSEAMFAYVVSNVMRAGAQIYCMIGGWYQPDDYKTKMAFGMISVSSEMERFIRLTAAKKSRRASIGTLIHSVPCWAYRIERDERLTALRKVPDEQHRTVIEAAARLVIEGVGWGLVERELMERFGLTKNGKPYTRYTFYWLFHNPNFFGNEFIGRTSGRDKRKIGYSDLWVFDPSYPPPEGAQIFYGVMPAYLDDTESGLGELLKAELRRRRHSIRGTASPRNSHKFTGLLSCYYCGRKLVYHPAYKKPLYYYQCSSKYTSVKTDRCMKVRMIREEIIRAWFHRELEDAVKEIDPEHFLHRRDEASRTSQAQQLKVRRDQLDQQIERSIDEQLLTDDEDMRLRLRNRADAMSSEKREIDRQIIALESQHSNDAVTARRAFERLTAYPDLKSFWESGDNNVNQILHGLLGDTLIVIRDQVIWGEAERAR